MKDFKKKQVRDFKTTLNDLKRVISENIPAEHRHEFVTPEEIESAFRSGDSERLMSMRKKVLASVQKIQRMDIDGNENTSNK